MNSHLEAQLTPCPCGNGAPLNVTQTSSRAIIRSIVLIQIVLVIIGFAMLNVLLVLFGVVNTTLIPNWALWTVAILLAYSWSAPILAGMFGRDKDGFCRRCARAFRTHNVPASLRTVAAVEAGAVREAAIDRYVLSTNTRTHRTHTFLLAARMVTAHMKRVGHHAAQPVWEAAGNPSLAGLFASPCWARYFVYTHCYTDDCLPHVAATIPHTEPIAYLSPSAMLVPTRTLLTVPQGRDQHRSLSLQLDPGTPTNVCPRLLLAFTSAPDPNPLTFTRVHDYLRGYPHDTRIEWAETGIRDGQWFTADLIDVVPARLVAAARDALYDWTPEQVLAAWQRGTLEDEILLYDATY